MGLVKYNFYIITYAKIQHLGSSSGTMFIPSFIQTDQLFHKLKQVIHMHLHMQPSCLKTLLLFLILGMKVG